VRAPQLRLSNPTAASRLTFYLQKDDPMDMTGEYRIAAPRDKVWQSLNDPAILQQCIPGCEALEKISDTELDGKVKAKVGPVSARFGGKVTLSDLDPPNSYKISGEGTGGAAGFAKGGAAVDLRDDNGATVLSYKVEANVGGKLAQIGSRLIDATARQMAENFFSKFAQVVGGPAPAAAAAAAASSASGPAVDPVPVTVAEMPPAPGSSVEMPPPVRTPPPGAATGKRLSPGVWVTALAIIVVVLLYFFTR
jgi:hypothetical protein